jgi:hypothetical protein
LLCAAFIRVGSSKMQSYRYFTPYSNQTGVGQQTITKSPGIVFKSGAFLCGLSAIVLNVGCGYFLRVYIK